MQGKSPRRDQEEEEEAAMKADVVPGSVDKKHLFTLFTNASQQKSRVTSMIVMASAVQRRKESDNEIAVVTAVVVTEIIVISMLRVLP